jgi:transcriptional regulator with XRE-family HTH domain
MATTQKHPSKAELKKASANSRVMISDWMKKNRTKRDMSQALLAELAGIDRKTINRIENGHFSPIVDTMTRVALVLGTKIPQLV